MLHYVYDGSFEGLLTCVHEAYYRREAPAGISCGEALQENLLMQYETIQTEEGKAEKVLRALRNKLSEDILQNVFHAYLSELPEIELWILRYVQLAFRVGPAVDSHLWEDSVLKILEVTRKVRFESHRMLGLLRFRELAEGTYYAPMGPDHNIVSLIAPHFAARLSDQRWMIHDIMRNIGALYNGREWTLVLLRQRKALPLHENELEFQRLWKQYFESIAIAGRRNPRLQRQHMPSRYWLYLVEK
jgi:probable DNA metabolism protein